jgi:hypothetical protein
MSLCDPVLPDFAEPTVCWVDFVLGAKARAEAGIWKPLETLRRSRGATHAARVERRPPTCEVLFAARRFCAGAAKGAERGG